jgi:hypothetical protein
MKYRTAIFLKEKRIRIERKDVEITKQDVAFTLFDAKKSLFASLVARARFLRPERRMGHACGMCRKCHCPVSFQFEKGECK